MADRIEAGAEGSFAIEDYGEQRSQVINFFMGVLYRVPLQDAERLAEKLWELLAQVPQRDARDQLRKDALFRLSQLDKQASLEEQCHTVNEVLNLLHADPALQAVPRSGRIHIETLDLEVLKPRTAAVRLGDEEKLVFGAAPDFIKPFLAGGETIPGYIILSSDTFRDGLNFAEVEFSIYGNYFLQNKRRVTIVCTPQQEARLRRVLTVTLFGPDFESLLQRVKDPKRIAEYQRLMSYRDILAVRDEAGEVIPLEGFVRFVHFEQGRAQLELTDGRRVTILAAEENPDLFTISDEQGEIMGQLDLSRIQREEFDFPVERTPLPRDEFGIFVLDSGDGFSPQKHTSSFLLWLEGQPLLVDPMAYSDHYLKRKGIDAGEIVDIFVSHNHGDHDQGVYNYLIQGRRIRLLGSNVIIRQTLEKVAAAIDTSVAELEELVDLVALPVGGEVPLPGYENLYVELAYGLHSIPTNMLKLRYRDEAGQTLKTFGYSADTIFDPERYAQWVDEGKLGQESVDILTTFFDDVDVLIHEAGGGRIHTEMEKVLERHRGKEIYWVHTPKTSSEVGGRVLAAGDRITMIPETAERRLAWYQGLFERVPLFANLEREELLQLARMAAEHRQIEVVNYMAGETIVREGEEPGDDTFYVIAQGSVDVQQQGRHVASLGVGQQVGEMALFGNNQGRRNASVIAFSGVRLIKIHQGAYDSFRQKVEKAYRTYAQARATLDASNSPFHGLNTNILDNIAARMDHEVFQRPQEGPRPILIRKGQSSERMLYVILAGEVGAIVDRQKGIGFRLGPGAVLGEMTLLDEHLSPSATVVVISDRVEAFTLSKTAFDDIVEKFPSVRYVLEGMSRKRQRINRIAEERRRGATPTV